jgi:hypothetical protein
MLIIEEMSIPDECYFRNGHPGNSGDHNTSIMSIPDECYSRNGYPGNSGDHNTSIMSIPVEYYSRNGYRSNSGNHNTSIMSIPESVMITTITWVTISGITFIRYAHY